jgi:hypothetical protein
MNSPSKLDILLRQVLKIQHSSTLVVTPASLVNSEILIDYQASLSEEVFLFALKLNQHEILG